MLEDSHLIHKLDKNQKQIYFYLERVFLHPALQDQDMPGVEIVLARGGGHVGFHQRGFSET